MTAVRPGASRLGLRSEHRLARHISKQTQRNGAAAEGNLGGFCACVCEADRCVKLQTRNVTVEVADELRRRYVEYDEVPAPVLEFLESATSLAISTSLRAALVGIRRAGARRISCCRSTYHVNNF
jgi:hypothetical protein